MIRPLGSHGEAQRCAAMMCSTDPWLTLGRTVEECLALVADPTRETYVYDDGGEMRGVIVLNMRGAIIGYVHTLCVAEGERGRGIGTALIRFAEERIFRETPNVFGSVSDFNTRARALYERLGYRVVGELKDYVTEGTTDLLMRKTIGPLRRRS